jgi:hypothetical protein
MKTFKQKSLYAALAGVSALGVTGAAQAVNVNPDGLGQVLIYPYYTTRDKVPGAAFSSLLTVVNSTASAKAVKVRFLEGKNSQEVLDFNLFLSKKDVWTAAILQTADGAGVGSFDNSCTIPKVSSTTAAPVIHDFVNVLLDDAVGDDSLDRTREGYVEIIEMGSIVAGSATEKAVTHVAGVPPGCATISDASVLPDVTTPTGGLFGDMTLINVLAGEDYTADAVALDNFRNIGGYDTADNILPDLTQANPPVSVVVANNAFYQSGWGNPIDAISALFMHDHVFNTFILDTTTKSGTDWVLTFPTKRYYYDSDGFVNYLFQRNIDANGGCDDVTLTVYDREEATSTPTIGFSPTRPGKANTLCWEANVLTFNASQVVGSTNNRSITTSYQNGWADLNFTLAPGTRGQTGAYAHILGNFGTQVTPLGGGAFSTDVSYVGLPVIGFALESYNNGTLTGADGSLVQSQYGGNFVHKGTRSILQFGPAP